MVHASGNGKGKVKGKLLYTETLLQLKIVDALPWLVGDTMLSHYCVVLQRNAPLSSDGRRLVVTLKFVSGLGGTM
jgi:hypothetical protein